MELDALVNVSSSGRDIRLKGRLRRRGELGKMLCQELRQGPCVENACALCRKNRTPIIHVTVLRSTALWNI